MRQAPVRVEPSAGGIRPAERSRPARRYVGLLTAFGPPSVADTFFSPYEKVIESFVEVNDALTGVFERRSAEGRQFAWRGAVDATWGLHSSLYRRLDWTLGASDPPNESELAAREGEIVADAHRWGLHNGPRGRLAVLEQLATLQHFGAPTRLVDTSLNAYIGLWFAVEERWADGEQIMHDLDGRLFAIDITDRLINEQASHRAWEDDYLRPWRNLPAGERWSGRTWAWEPPPFEARIASQRGAFLFSGVPQTGQGLAWPRGGGAGGNWPIATVRRGTSLALRFHQVEAEGGAGRPSEQPAFTFRIKAAAKPEIRARLNNLFGYNHRTLYRDYSGFAQFGSPCLRTRP